MPDPSLSASEPNEQTWEDRVLDSARTNHIWLNAFSCVRPTPEFEREVGQTILAFLNQRENLIPPEYPLTGTEYEYQLVVRINKS